MTHNNGDVRVDSCSHLSYHNFAMTDWQSSLFDCFKDWKICCYGCWCTARLYAKNAVQITGSNYDDAFYTYMNSGDDACPWTSVAATRRALREKYDLPEEPCDDCSVIFFCAPCSVCQAARELKSRNNISGTVREPVVTTQPTHVNKPDRVSGQTQ